MAAMANHRVIMNNQLHRRHNLRQRNISRKRREIMAATSSAMQSAGNRVMKMAMKATIANYQ